MPDCISSSVLFNKESFKKAFVDVEPVKCFKSVRDMVVLLKN